MQTAHGELDRTDPVAGRVSARHRLPESSATGPRVRNGALFRPLTWLFAGPGVMSGAHVTVQMIEQ